MALSLHDLDASALLRERTRSRLRRCDACGGRFEAKGRGRYCTARCRVNAWRERQQDPEERLAAACRAYDRAVQSKAPAAVRAQAREVLRRALAGNDGANVTG